MQKTKDKWMLYTYQPWWNQKFIVSKTYRKRTKILSRLIEKYPAYVLSFLKYFNSDAIMKEKLL